jgi:spermidine synthase
MGLEIVAARVLAPALGSSIYVWGSVISIVLAALALGYWLGGQAADRYDAARVLPATIAGAAVATVLAPVVALGVLPRVTGFDPRLGSLLAATFIFFVPALLLATVSPLGVRIASSRGLSHVGRSAGGLYAVSTAGSIFGTLLTAFWLIPVLSLEPLIVWIGLLLAITSLAALALPRTAPEPRSDVAPPMRGTASATLALAATAAAIGVIVLLQVAPPPAVNEYGETVLYRNDSQYHRISVTEDDDARHLRFDHSHQSAIALDDPYASRILYPDYLHLAVAANPDAERVLVLGLGGGAITKRMWRDYPEMTIDSVEIDPAVVDVARDYFGLPEDERSRVFVEDARRYIQRTSETYDIIIIDAYYADSLPSHLTTREFLSEVDERLAPGGVVAYNVISAVDGDGSDLFRSMYRTADAVWDRLWVFPIEIAEDDDLARRRNIIVLATDSDLAEEELLARIESKVDGRVTIRDFERFGEDLYTDVIRLADVPVLTDSHAPTDSLIEVQ